MLISFIWTFLMTPYAPRTRYGLKSKISLISVLFSLQNGPLSYVVTKPLQLNFRLEIMHSCLAFSHGGISLKLSLWNCSCSGVQLLMQKQFIFQQAAHMCVHFEPKDKLGTYDCQETKPTVCQSKCYEPRCIGNPALSNGDMTYVDEDNTISR